MNWSTLEQLVRSKTQAGWKSATNSQQASWKSATSSQQASWKSAANKA